MQGRFVDTEEYAKVMNMAPWTVRQLIRSGVIPAVRLPSRRYAIPTSALDEMEGRARAEAQARAQAQQRAVR
jgi:excisionase family DNA binding protein